MRYLQDVPSAKKLSRIGLGTWQFGSREWGYGDDFEAEAGRMVARAVELGITVVDTAEAYGFGASERIVGAALREHGLREQVYVATKIFPFLPIAPVVVNRGRASAGRLGVERIDLYQVHQPNPVVKDGQTMPGMRQLQEEGVVADVGVSNYSLARWKDAERALGLARFSGGLMAALGAVVGGERRAEVLNTMVGMALGLASGAAFPSQSLPAFLRERVTPCLPPAWFIDSVRATQARSSGASATSFTTGSSRTPAPSGVRRSATSARSTDTRRAGSVIHETRGLPTSASSAAGALSS